MESKKATKEKDLLIEKVAEFERYI